MILSFEPHSDPDIDFVWEWFEFQIALIGQSRATVLRSVGLAFTAMKKSLGTHEARFIGFTRSEVDEFFDAQTSQLEPLTMFEILATTEAVLRIEVKTRVAGRRKDGLSRRFRQLHQAMGDRIRLDEDILGAMNEEGVPGKVINAFRGVLKLRHWLAHGRHWHPRLGRGYGPSDVFDISRLLIDSIPPS